VEVPSERNFNIELRKKYLMKRDLIEKYVKEVKLMIG
jgi:hypothetical protein